MYICYILYFIISYKAEQSDASIHATMSQQRKEGEGEANPTHIVLIVDESGSMDQVRQRTLSSINEYLNDQKREKGEAMYTITKFSTSVSWLRTQQQISDYKEVTMQDYVPGGMTALYDAIGQVITKYRGDENYEYLVVIITDGEENSSKEYSQFAINEMIRKQRTKNWEFVFMGANQDSWAEGGKIGIAHNINYSYGNMQECCKMVSDATKLHRKSKRSGVAAFASLSAATKNSVPQQQQQTSYTGMWAAYGGRGK
jgi:Mg-chelatase subunit ChlD